MKNGISWEDKSSKVMVGPYGLTHEERFQVRNEITDSTDFFELFKERLSPRDLSNFSQKFRFIVSVRGNGVDTHRHWETAYRGSFALIRKSPWLKNFEGVGLPFIGVDSFTVNEIQIAISQITNPPRDPLEIPFLWWPYWKSLIKSRMEA
jgi:hypothetical protein